MNNTLDYYSLTSEDLQILNRFGHPLRYTEDEINEDNRAQDFRFEINWGMTPAEYVIKKQL